MNSTIHAANSSANAGPSDAAAAKDIDQQHDGRNGAEHQPGRDQPAREVEPQKVAAAATVGEIGDQRANEADDRHRQQASRRSDAGRSRAGLTGLRATVSSMACLSSDRLDAKNAPEVPSRLPRRRLRPRRARVMTAHKPGDPLTLNRLYGRSSGHKLRKGQQELVEHFFRKSTFRPKARSRARAAVRRGSPAAFRDRLRLGRASRRPRRHAARPRLHRRRAVPQRRRHRALRTSATGISPTSGCGAATRSRSFGACPTGL